MNHPVCEGRMPATCNSGTRMAPIPKIHNSMTVCLSAKSLFSKEASQWSLLDTAKRPFCKTWALNSGITSRTQLVHSSGWCCKNRSAWLWEYGVYGQYRIGTQHRDLDGWHCIFSLHNSCMLWVAFPLPEPWVSVWDKNPMLWPDNKAPEFPIDALIFQVDRVPAYFHWQMLFRLLFLALVFWIGDISIGLRPHTKQGALFQPKYPFEFLAATCECGGQPFILRKVISK